MTMLKKRPPAILSCCLALSLALMMLPGAQAAVAKKKHASAAATKTAAHAKHVAAHGKAGRSRRAVIVTRRGRHRVLSAKARARTQKIQQAFVASSQLRPMAQQLGNYRSPAAYAGVEAYARAHTGEAASAAYLALGHAYLLDKRFPEALAALHSAAAQGQSLDDYIDYFAAQADLQSNQLAAADTILSSFPQKYPDSIFDPSIPVLEANLYLQQQDPQAALRVLKAHAGEPVANKGDYTLAMARAEQLAGQTAEASDLFRKTVFGYPLSNEATLAKAQLVQAGIWQTLPADERRRHADTLYNSGRFSEAAEEFHQLGNDPAINASERSALLVAAAGCDFKLKRLSKEELDRIPDSSDETGAHRLYLLMEVARSNNDTLTQFALVDQLRSRFPDSTWLSEALYSSGNMYLLRKDFPTAITYYLDQAKRFPHSTFAPAAHWRAAWLNYRIRNFSDAARLMDEQIALFPGGKEIPATLYWRGRLYMDQERSPAMAATYFSTVARVYEHYYYAAIARERLASLGSVTPAVVNVLDNMQPESIPTLTEDVPEDDPHLAKARLLANAGLNDFLSQEIHAAEGSDGWGGVSRDALAQARAAVLHLGADRGAAARLLADSFPAGLLGDHQGGVRAQRA
jgi:soluble lytic murein transglycosylase